MHLKISICTPTYNRAHLLGKLYESLKIQDFQEFEWIIIDDGSNDETEKVVQEFKNESLININYLKKSNGGKHTALNIGIDNARGELFWIVDSDDYIVEDSLNCIWNTWCSIENKNEFAGVAGLKSYENKELIGTNIQGEYLDADVLEYRYKYKIKGDKAEVFITDILKKFRFPEFLGEKYISPALVWNRIANENLKIRWFNKTTCICEYLEGGLTNISDTNLIQSWKGTTLYYKELLSYKKVPLNVKVLNGCRGYLHYCYVKKIGFKGIKNITKNPLYISMALGMYSIKKLKKQFK